MDKEQIDFHLANIETALRYPGNSNFNLNAQISAGALRRLLDVPERMPVPVRQWKRETGK